MRDEVDNMTENAFIRQTLALTVRELRHWYRSKIQVFMAVVQPLIWLGLFGVMMSGMLQSQIPNYFSFLALGVVVITALTTAMSSGMSLIWDRRFGFLSKLRAAPIPRGVIPLSRVLAATVKAILQCTLVFCVALILSRFENASLITDAFSVWSIPVLYLCVIGVGMTFSSVFVALGLIIKTHESFLAANTLLMMPLMFMSGAMFPLNYLNPNGFGKVLIVIAKGNPLTYAADALRHAFLGKDTMLAVPSVSLGVGIIILMVVALAVTILGMYFGRRALRTE